MTLCKELFNVMLRGLIAEPFRDVRWLSTGGAGGGGKFKRSVERQFRQTSIAEVCVNGNFFVRLIKKIKKKFRTIID